MHRGVRRTATAVALAELIPVPLLDTYAQNRARRWLVRSVAAEEGLTISEERVIEIADEPMEPMKRIALWPVKTVLKKVFIVFGVIAVGRNVREVLQVPAQVVAPPDDGAVSDDVDALVADAAGANPLDVGGR